MYIAFMRNNERIALITNVAVVPRIGDGIVIINVKAKVLDVIWHYDYETWVEIQI